MNMIKENKQNRFRIFIQNMKEFLGEDIQDTEEEQDLSLQFPEDAEAKELAASLSKISQYSVNYTKTRDAIDRMVGTTKKATAPKKHKLSTAQLNTAKKIAIENAKSQEKQKDDDNQLEL